MRLVGSDIRDALGTMRWNVADLWVETSAIGGYLDQRDVDDIAAGRRRPTESEYKALAAAINEGCTELGRQSPMRDWASLIKTGPKTSNSG